jgi:hypothetical protein
MFVLSCSNPSNHGANYHDLGFIGKSSISRGAIRCLMTFRPMVYELMNFE